MAERSTSADSLRVAVMGCSTGGEAYSISWVIGSARPDLKLSLHAVDISRQAVAIGKRGKYSLLDAELATDIFERMTDAEMEEFFDRKGEVAAVKLWIRKGIKWHVGDVGDPEVVDVLGCQDIVVANYFLCDMDAAMAERCLRNIARLVRPHGFLFVSGIDLDIRTKFAVELGFVPLRELLEEIHEGDPSLRSHWPFHYRGLEPLNKKRRDWRLRYAAAFQLVPSGAIAAGSGRDCRDVHRVSASGVLVHQ